MTTPHIDPGSTDDLVFGPDGLIPAVVQDSVSRRVLMVGWLNRDSLDLTSTTGRVHFWSRSRQRIWMKGEQSGNVLDVVELRPDCDRDTLLILVTPTGPTCHTGAISCFDDPADPPPPAQGFAWLEELWAVIAARAVDPPRGSYTASLLDGGVDAVARKVTEEATEVLMAAKDHAHGGPDQPLAEESADLVYHLLVLLAERQVEPETVLAALRMRQR